MQSQILTAQSFQFGKRKLIEQGLRCNEKLRDLNKRLKL